MTFFPVPDEFYRDLTYLGWSAEEYALWIIAGSWSADRLTDGSVPTAALALFPAFASSAADALVTRGIWKRARGGYQYVEWPEQCSRKFVLAKRERERLKKQGQRAAWKTVEEKKTSSKQVVSPGDTGGDTPGTAPRTTPGSPGPSSKPVTQDQELLDQPPSGVGARTSARTPAKKATRIPEDFAATPAMIAWARENTPLVGQAETENFKDYWFAAEGRTASKRDWVAAWRYWMRGEQKKAAGWQARGAARSSPARSTTAERVAGWDDLPSNDVRLPATGTEGLPLIYAVPDSRALPRGEAL